MDHYKDKIRFAVKDELEAAIERSVVSPTLGKMIEDELKGEKMTSKGVRDVIATTKEIEAGVGRDVVEAFGKILVEEMRLAPKSVTGEDTIGLWSIVGPCSLMARIETGEMTEPTHEFNDDGEVIVTKEAEPLIKWKKLSAMGGERLRVVGSYVGKRDGLIIQMNSSEIRGVDLVTVELNVRQCRQSITGFSKFLESKLNSSDDLVSIVEKEREEILRRKREVAEIATKEKVTIYGTEWGGW